MPVDDTQLRSLLREGIPDTFPGAVAAIGTSGGISRTYSLGTIDQNGTVEASDTVTFDVASITKPLVTTTIALRLMERGQLALSDSIGTYVAELADTDRGDVTVGHLLTHTSGLRYCYDDSWEDLDDVLDGIYEAELLEADPGERHEYSCINYIHLAAVIRECTDESIRELADRHVFTPVGMEHSQLGPIPDADESVAWTYDHNRGGGALHGEIHDPIARITAGESGNAGLFSTAGDIARFVRMLFNDGEIDGTQVLSPSTVSALRRDHTGDHLTPHSLGWRIARDNIPAPTWTMGADSLGHTGYTGTSLWIDFAADKFAMLLTNQVLTGKDDDMETRRERFYGITGAMLSTA